MKYSYKCKNFIKNNSGSMLSIAGCIGTVVTTILAVKAGIKIKENDMEVKDAIKECIPTMISCAASIGCVVAGDSLNRKQKSELLALCTTAGASYSAYRQEVIKRYGEEVDRDIVDTVAKYSDVCYMAPEIPDKVCHWIIDMCVDDIPVYEIDACERDIIHAEYHFNRNYILGMSQSVANLLEFLEIETSEEEQEYNKTYGWLINDSEIYFLDFEHHKIDEDTFKLTPVFTPWYNFEELDMFGEPI